MLKDRFEVVLFLVFVFVLGEESPVDWGSGAAQTRGKGRDNDSDDGDREKEPDVQLE